MKRDDDLFLEALEQDDELAWRLAEASSRRTPAYLRERIVERHRRRLFGVPLRPIAAVAAAVLAIAILIDQTQGADLEVLSAVAGDAIHMHMRPAADGGRGTLLVRKDAQAYLVLDLPAPPPGKAYEAWVIRDGRPIRAGMAPARGGIVTMRLQVPVRPGDMAAVTLEDAAGVDAPTTRPILIGPG